VLRASAVAERAGFPTVSIVASAFMKQALLLAQAQNIDFRLAEYCGTPMVDNDETLLAKVDQLTPDVVKGLTASTPAMPALETAGAEPEPGTVVFSGSLDEVQDHFYRRLWSDGLPIIPPTRERVDAFLKFTDRDPKDVIAVLPQEDREASILSVAITGVMSGCRPEYMPLLIAIIEAISDRQFRLEDAGSTPAWEPLVIVSGPIIKAIDLNYGAGVMKVGRRANSSIGRFLRLYMRNICGYRIPPGAGDKGSIGYTFNVALAEDESFATRIGWPTFAMDRGYPNGTNLVTVQSVICITPPTYSAGDRAEQHVRQFVEVIGNAFAYWAYRGLRHNLSHPLIVVGPAIAEVIAREWTKDQVRSYLWQHTKMPASRMQHFAVQTAGLGIDFHELVKLGHIAEDYIASDDPNRLVRTFLNARDIGLVVAGDPGRNQSRGYLSNCNQGVRTSRQVELPRDWEHLLSEAQGI
jgi:hypothetical protein